MEKEDLMCSPPGRGEGLGVGGVVEGLVFTVPRGGVSELWLEGLRAPRIEGAQMLAS